MVGLWIFGALLFVLGLGVADFLTPPPYSVLSSQTQTTSLVFAPATSSTTWTVVETIANPSFTTRTMTNKGPSSTQTTTQTLTNPPYSEETITDELTAYGHAYTSLTTRKTAVTTSYLLPVVTPYFHYNGSNAGFFWEDPGWKNVNLTLANYCNGTGSINGADGLQNLLYQVENTHSYTEKLTATIAPIPPYCLFLYDSDNSTVPPLVTEQFFILNGTESNSSSPTDPNNPLVAASSSAAALARADADYQRSHLQAIGLGVGLGICLPLVIVVSAAGALLLYRRRLLKERSQQAQQVEASPQDAIYSDVGTERASPTHTSHWPFGTKTETNGT